VAKYSRSDGFPPRWSLLSVAEPRPLIIPDQYCYCIPWLTVRSSGLQTSASTRVLLLCRMNCGDNACGHDYPHARHDEESPFRPGHINLLAERTHSPVSVRAPTRRRIPVLVPSVTPCVDDCCRVSVCCRPDLHSAEWADFDSKKCATPTNRSRQRQPVVSVGFCDAASRTSARRRWESLCSVGAVLTKRYLRQSQ
jgi:hypothetical protein